MDKHRQHQALIDFFKRYLRKDPALIEAIEAFGLSFQLTNEHWRFTLSDLYEFCRIHVSDIKSLNYQEFKQLLYQNSTNQCLQAYQGVFDIYLNSGRVNTSIYCLRSDASPLNIRDIKADKIAE